MLQEHVRDFYHPEHFVISIAGKFDEKQVIEQLSRGLNRLSVGMAKPNVGAPSYERFNVVKHRDIEQAHLVMAAPGIKMLDPRRYALAILDLCLGGNMSSRLFQEVREKRGLVYSINTFRESHTTAGLFGVYAGTSPKHVAQVLELTGQEFQKVKEEGLTDEEIARAKTQLKAELLLGLESMRYRTSRNAYSELYYGRQLTVEEICKDIDQVTSAELKKIANEFLRHDQLSLVVVGPITELKTEYALAC